jgi:hypothetical protein
LFCRSNSVEKIDQCVWFNTSILRLAERTRRPIWAEVEAWLYHFAFQWESLGSGRSGRTEKLPYLLHFHARDPFTERNLILILNGRDPRRYLQAESRTVLPDANMGKFWSALKWKLFANFRYICSIYTAMWHILRPFGIFVVILIYFSRFGTLYEEKSGNPGLERCGGVPMLSTAFFVQNKIYLWCSGLTAASPLVSLILKDSNKAELKYRNPDLFFTGGILIHKYAIVHMLVHSDTRDAKTWNQK